jgi:PAS domain-containing protein
MTPDATALEEDLVHGGCDAAQSLFHAIGARAPIVVWDPHPVDLGHPALRSFLTVCAAARNGAGVIREAAVADMPLDRCARWLMELEPLEDGHFRYRRYGPSIAAHYGRDMTGRTTRDFPGHISKFFTALYRAAVRRRKLAMSVHEPPDQVFVRSWRRLMAPVFDEQDRLTRLLAVNVPDNDLKAGLEALPDPILVIQEDGVVAFANAAAQRFFGERAFSFEAVAFRDYTGLDLPLADPAAWWRETAMTQTRMIGVREDLIVHFEVTQSALIYRDQRFIVAVVKPS